MHDPIFIWSQIFNVMKYNLVTYLLLAIFIIYQPARQICS